MNAAFTEIGPAFHIPPSYSLVIQGNNFLLRKFVLEEGWVPKTLDVYIDVPIDISSMRCKGLQSWEELLPDGAAEDDGISANEDIVSQLASMGFQYIHCQKAAINTLNAGVEEAMNWSLNHMNDPDIDEPITKAQKGGPNVDQSKVETLISFGFEEEVAREALQASLLVFEYDTPPGRPFAPRTRSPPLPFLLSSILQSRPEVKLPSEQFGDDDIDDGLDECSDSEEDSEYDELPPFKPLTKAQLEKLSKVQREAYYDELEYREKLFMKKQLKEERKRRKRMKKMQEAVKNMPADYGDNGEEETSAAASVPVPMPDLALPASFDFDNPTHRYRSLDSSNPWLVRAVLEPNGWDHDIGYDGINVERLFVVKEKISISFSGHVSKDKKDANLQMEVASSVKRHDMVYFFV